MALLSFNDIIFSSVVILIEDESVRPFLYSGTIPFEAERDLKLTRLSALISPYLTKLMKHNKSNTTFLREIVIMVSLIYLSEATYVISSFK